MRRWCVASGFITSCIQLLAAPVPRRSEFKFLGESIPDPDQEDATVDRTLRTARATWGWLASSCFIHMSYYFYHFFALVAHLMWFILLYAFIIGNSNWVNVTIASIRIRSIVFHNIIQYPEWEYISYRLCDTRTCKLLWKSSAIAYPRIILSWRISCHGSP